LLILPANIVSSQGPKQFAVELKDIRTLGCLCP
jgi:hypothetical protein